jgi:hypothetical protein
MWSRAVLIGLLTALTGCTFDRASPFLDPGAAPDAGGTGGSRDAAPDARADAGPAEEVLLETLTVPADGSLIASVTVLRLGVQYRLVATGSCVEATGGGGWSADAEYYWKKSQPQSPSDFANLVDVGLAVDDPLIDAIRTPRWGDYQGEDHTYEVTFTGIDLPISAQFHDDYYPDNDGSLSLEIHGPHGGS